MTLRKSISVWILGFLTFLAALCSFAVTIYWINEGPNFILQPLLLAGMISDLVGDLTVQTYLWALLTATFIFFGLTCLVGYKKAPPDPEMLRMFVKIGGNLAALQSNQEGMATELSERIETGKQISREYFKKIDTNFEQSKEEMFTALHNHEKVIQKSRRELSSIFGTKLAKSREELLSVLRKQEKTSFLVTNGLCPEILEKLNKNNQLPTQLYLSLNASNKKLYEKFTRSSLKDAWEKFNKTLELFPKLKTRKVIRMTLVKELNINKEYIKEYIKLIKKAMPDFIEVKSFMSVGFSRQRLGYDRMPSHEEIKKFSGKILKMITGYKFLDEKFESRVVLLGKDKSKMKIKKVEV